MLEATSIEQKTLQLNKTFKVQRLKTFSSIIPYEVPALPFLQLK